MAPTADGATCPANYVERKNSLKKACWRRSPDLWGGGKKEEEVSSPPPGRGEDEEEEVSSPPPGWGEEEEEEVGRRKKEGKVFLSPLMIQDLTRRPQRFEQQDLIPMQDQRGIGAGRHRLWKTKDRILPVAPLRDTGRCMDLQRGQGLHQAWIAALREMPALQWIVIHWSMVLQPTFQLL
ncbi:hypothetical protein CRUP_016027, partial [Coryphaenoides rupestris]